MAKECCQCKYHRNSVWYVEELELATDQCTLDHICDADDCPDFEEIISEEIDYDV